MLSYLKTDTLEVDASGQMHADLDYRVLRDTIFTHPSISEVFNDLFGQIH